MSRSRKGTTPAKKTVTKKAAPHATRRSQVQGDVPVRMKKNLPAVIEKRELDTVSNVRRTRKNIRKPAEPNQMEQLVLRSFEGQQVADPFEAGYVSNGIGGGINNILSPPYNPFALLRLPEENNMLKQCIEAMVINIESFGHTFEYTGPEGQEESSEAKLEKARLEALLAYPNGQYTLLELRERRRKDLETFGYAYLEICRDGKNQIISLYHAPAQYIRMTAVDGQDTPVSVPIVRDGRVQMLDITRQFRRFVQNVYGKNIWFKEFGDPRVIDPTTGQENPALAPEEGATEIYMSGFYTPGTPYGVPRWINQIPSIMGSRESEVTNLNFFKDNAIPAMTIMVSGGGLTQESIEEIEEHIQAVRGRQSSHRIMVLEATGDKMSAGDDGRIAPPKIEMKSMIGERQEDAFFQAYDKNNQQKIRSSFRLPPIFVGLSEDTRMANAQQSLIVAESQVFGNERNKTDDVFNQHLLADEKGIPPQYWRMRSNPPRLSDPETLINALAELDAVGALTPNIAIGMANELFDLHIKPIVEAWGDYPFALVLALAGSNELKGIEDIALPPSPDTPAPDAGGGTGPKPKVPKPSTTPKPPPTEEQLKQAKRLTVGLLAQIKRKVVNVQSLQ